MTRPGHPHPHPAALPVPGIVARKTRRPPMKASDPGIRPLRGKRFVLSVRRLPSGQGMEELPGELHGLKDAMLSSIRGDSGDVRGECPTGLYLGYVGAAWIRSGDCGGCFGLWWLRVAGVRGYRRWGLGVVGGGCACHPATHPDRILYYATFIWCCITLHYMVISYYTNDAIL